MVPSLEPESPCQKHPRCGQTPRQRLANAAESTNLCPLPATRTPQDSQSLPAVWKTSGNPCLVSVGNQGWKSGCLGLSLRSPSLLKLSMLPRQIVNRPREPVIPIACRWVAQVGYLVSKPHRTLIPIACRWVPQAGSLRGPPPLLADQPEPPIRKKIVRLLKGWLGLGLRSPSVLCARCLPLTAFLWGFEDSAPATQLENTEIPVPCPGTSAAPAHVSKMVHASKRASCASAVNWETQISRIVAEDSAEELGTAMVAGRLA